MVDAGTGDLFGPTLGKLPTVMTALGFDPAAIDTLVFTHLHGDHIGGTVSPAGNPYTNATLRVASADIDFWTSEEIQAQAPDAFKPAFDLARRLLQVSASVSRRLAQKKPQSLRGSRLCRYPAIPPAIQA